MSEIDEKNDSPILLVRDEASATWKLTIAIEVSEAAFLAACYEEMEKRGILVVNAWQSVEIVECVRDLRHWLDRCGTSGVCIEVIGGDGNE